MDLAVVTPTICSDLEHLRDCVRSVHHALKELAGAMGVHGTHYVVVDLDEDHPIPAGAEDVVRSCGARLLRLPHATGKGGWVGHRVNAAAAWLLPQKYISFLDDDNWVLGQHYVWLFQALGQRFGAQWAHCLRAVVAPDGRTCPDACESLGLISHSVLGPGDRLVDTNCYLLETQLARDLSGLWNAKARDPDRPEADRALAQVLVSNFKGVLSRHHSVRYRTGSRGDSVRYEFFERGNAVWGHDFEGKSDLYLFWMHPQVTAGAVAATARTAGQSVALAEWNLSQVQALRARYNVLDGYANAAHLPHKAKVLVALCFPEPLEALDGLLRKRADLRVLVWTAEGPNYRHRKQWTQEWLQAQFGANPRLMTYFQPLLGPLHTSVFMPHNTHSFAWADLGALPKPPRPASDRSVVIVLEPRPGSAAYSLHGLELRQLDHRRAELLAGLRATVVGRGWAAAAARVGPEASAGWTVVEVEDRQADKPSFEYYAAHQFAVIVENCDAPGYVSEKLYDALAAGCIPLYYDAGNMATPEMRFLRDSGTFVDISRCESGFEVAALLEAMSDADVAALQQQILRRRGEILERVGADRFEQTVSEVFLYKF